MIIGYARVSTDDQNLGVQIDALQATGAERIFSEKSRDQRATYQSLPSFSNTFAQVMDHCYQI